MTAKKKKQWTLIAACLMTLAALVYLVNGLLNGMGILKTIIVIMFSISAGLYWYRYKTEIFEDD